MQNLNDKTHRCQNPLTGNWVLVSPHRVERLSEGQLENKTILKLPE